MGTIQKQIKATNCFRKVMSRFEQPKWDKISITSYAYLKLLFIINLVGDHEVSGFGKLVNNKIVDWYIPQQVLGTLTANIDESAMFEMMKDIPAKELKHYIVDFHSHNTVGCSPSSTDKESYKLQAENRSYQQFIAMIVNKKEELWCKNVMQGEKFSDIKVTIESEQIPNDEAEKLFEECKVIVERNCFESVTIKEPEKPKVTPCKQNKLWSTPAKRNYTECQCCNEKLLTQREKENGYCDFCYRNMGLDEYDQYSWKSYYGYKRY